MAALVASFAARTPGVALLPAGSPVFVIGDSLSAGLGNSDAGTWPRLLAARLALPVSNLARAGATLADGTHQAAGIPRGEPAILLVELGGNDLLGEATPETFERDLAALLAVLKADGRKVAMFELPLLPFQNRYGRIQRRVCADHDVTHLPRYLLAGAVALPGHAADGLHLSPEGHAWLAERVAAVWGD